MVQELCKPLLPGPPQFPRMGEAEQQVGNTQGFKIPFLGEGILNQNPLFSIKPGWTQPAATWASEGVPACLVPGVPG